MTQQQMSKLLDVPDRTLRDWKKSRKRLYTLLESLEYDEAKEKINGVDIDDVVVFNPKEYSKTNIKRSMKKVISFQVAWIYL